MGARVFAGHEGGARLGQEPVVVEAALEGAVHEHDVSPRRPGGEAAEADIEIDRIVADDIGARDVRARVRASGGRFEEPGRIQHACVRTADAAPA